MKKTNTICNRTTSINNKFFPKKLTSFLLFCILLNATCVSKFTPAVESECIFNQQDSEYINAVLKKSFDCMSYYWTNCPKGKIEIQMFIDELGNVKNIVFITNETKCELVCFDINEKFVVDKFKFVELEITNPCHFNFSYSFEAPIKELYTGDRKCTSPPQPVSTGLSFPRGGIHPASFRIKRVKTHRASLWVGTSEAIAPG